MKTIPDPETVPPEVTAAREALSVSLRKIASDLVVADVGPFAAGSRASIVQALVAFCDLIDAQTRLHRGLRP